MGKRARLPLCPASCPRTRTAWQARADSPGRPAWPTSGIIVNDGKAGPLQRLNEPPLRGAGTGPTRRLPPIRVSGKARMDPTRHGVLRGARWPASWIPAPPRGVAGGIPVGPMGRNWSVGGKTGGGQTGWMTFQPRGGVAQLNAPGQSPRPTFVFYIGEAVFGVCGALVPGSATREATGFTAACRSAWRGPGKRRSNQRLKHPPPRGGPFCSRPRRGSRRRSWGAQAAGAAGSPGG